MFEFLHRAKGLYDGQWCEGNLVRHDGKVCTIMEKDGTTHICKAETLGLWSGQEDSTGRKVFSGQKILFTQHNGGTFKVCFGQYHAYDQSSNAWVPTTGFYLEDAAGGEMPLGALGKWAMVAGDE